MRGGYFESSPVVKVSSWLVVQMPGPRKNVIIGGYHECIKLNRCACRVKLRWES